MTERFDEHGDEGRGGPAGAGPGMPGGPGHGEPGHGWPGHGGPWPGKRFRRHGHGPWMRQAPWGPSPAWVGPPGWAGPTGSGPDPSESPGAPGWHRGHGHRGGRARRGDVRAAVLALLAEEPMNGYQIIQQIADRSGGLWRASPGSVYPALAQLEDEGLVERAADGHGRAYALTERGRRYVAEHAGELRAAWSTVGGDAASAAAGMRALVHQVHLAAFQVISAGTPAQVRQAGDVLAQARRALYGILAQEDDAPDAEAPGPEGGDAGRPAGAGGGAG